MIAILPNNFEFLAFESSVEDDRTEKSEISVVGLSDQVWPDAVTCHVP